MGRLKNAMKLPSDLIIEQPYGHPGCDTHLPGLEGSIGGTTKINQHRQPGM